MSDIFDESRYSPPSINYVAAFMKWIEELRAKQSLEEWRNTCRNNTSIGQWRQFLRQDPYTDHGYRKPRGYPGDAALMDFAYRHPAAAAPIAMASETGRVIYEITSKASQSISARQRLEVISETLNQILERQLLINSGHSSIQIASIASGHGREIEMFDPHYVKLVSKFLGVDSDPVSVETLKQYSSVLPIDVLPLSIFRLRTENVRERYNLVYSMGLFDYLDERAAILVLKKMIDLCQSGGTVLIGNLTDEAKNLGYCEAIMDWWMLPRSKLAMQALGSHVRSTRKIKSQRVKRRGDFYYLVLKVA